VHDKQSAPPLNLAPRPSDGEDIVFRPDADGNALEIRARGKWVCAGCIGRATTHSPFCKEGKN
jgi:hypothetical protein